MVMRYYALFEDEDGRHVALYVGKGLYEVDEDELLSNRKLLGIAMWNGRMPRIVSEYDLEELDDVVVLYPEED